MKENIKEWVENTKTNKREKATLGAYGSYVRSTDYYLHHVYGRYSVYKDRAFNEIQKEMYSLNGYGLKIISYSCQLFTCGYCVEFEDEVYFIRHTATYRDCVKVVE